MSQLKDFTLRLVAGANIVTIIIMLLLGYSDRVDAAAHPFIGVIGLAFPVFLVLNILFLLFWLCVRKRWAVIPLLGLIMGYGPISTYSPLSIVRGAPKGAMKVISYNVFCFHGWQVDENDSEVLSYLVEENADIVCLQEADCSPWHQKRLDSIMTPQYAYRDTSRNQTSGGDVIMVLSKYPIVKKEYVQYESKSNHSCAFWLLTGRADTTILVANHLESTALPQRVKERFKNMVKGDLKGDSVKVESKTLYAKLAVATAKRAPQAEAVARYVREHKRYPIILCGDFNDNPISYVHHTIAKELTDCYTATGNGPGISYNSNAFFVRIDNIMCSDHFVPYNCSVDRSIKASDHYPIKCWVKRRRN